MSIDKQKIKKKIILTIVQCSSCFLICVGIFAYLGEYLSWKNYDFVLKNFGGKIDKPSDDVVLILIDDATLSVGNSVGLGRWPWPRSIYFEILDYINKTDPPRAIFFDLLFTESDVTEPKNDIIFAEAISQAGNIFHNAIIEPEIERKIPQVLDKDIMENLSIPVKNVEIINKYLEPNNENFFPIPCLRSNVPCGTSSKEINTMTTTPESIIKGIAIASVKSDSDGMYRRSKLFHRYGEHYFPSMTLSAIMAYGMDPEITVNKNSLTVGKYTIPIGKTGYYSVNYHSKNRITSYSMGAILTSIAYMNKGEADKILIPPEIFKDKIVIIGISAVAGMDLKNTPIAPSTPGPEIHANIISNIIQNNHIIQQSTAGTLLSSLAIIIACSLIVIFFESSIIQGLGVLFTLIGYFAVSTLLFPTTNYLSNTFFVTFSGFLSSIVSFVYLSLTEGAEKRKYSKILSNMIDPSIVNEALKDLESLKKGGEKKITAFFSDVASFSTISEKLSSADLASLLNEYLSAMTLILKHNGGTLDKYIGDAIVGIFGAPLDLEKSEISAVKSAIEMRKKMKDLQELWKSQNAYCPEAQEMHFRIGLNTGIAKVGFMGTSELASYTMMGDTVNLAARLEAAGKDYAVDILISENTKVAIDQEIFVRLLDAVRVKGKNEPVLIYEVIGYINDIDPNTIQAVNAYEEGFNLYRARNFDLAIDKFQECQTLLGRKDYSSQLLIARCKFYKEQTPPETWDGVFTRTHK